MSRWFRHYAGMMRDEKLVRVAVKAKQPVERVVWVWGAILESAAEINDDGRYDFDAAEAAYFLRCDEHELADVLTELENAGRIAEGVVARWGDRQFSSDTAAERQRRYRERKRNTDDGNADTNSNGKRNSDARVTSRDGAVTPQETDTETYQKEAPNGASKKRGSRLPDDWEPNRDEAREAGLSEAEVDREAMKFRDHWRAAPGSKGVKLDWDATWRNWCRRAVETRPQPRSTAPPRRQNAVEALISRRMEQAHGSESRRSDSSDAELLPADKPELRALVGDLGQAMRWQE